MFDQMILSESMLDFVLGGILAVVNFFLTYLITKKETVEGFFKFTIAKWVFILILLAVTIYSRRNFYPAELVISFVTLNFIFMLLNIKNIFSNNTEVLRSHGK